METIQTRPRLALLDSLRGFALLHMIAYHTLCDLVDVFGHPMGWCQSQAGYIWQQSICWSFILLSGFCFSLGRQPVRRGAVVLAAGCLVELVTWIAMPQERVRFGILSFIGCAMLLTRLCRPVLEKLRPAAGLAASFAVFWLTKTVPQGGLGLGDRLMTLLPEWLYSTPWLYPLGFPRADFWSSDYFPLLPWLFLYWTGWFAFRMWPNVRESRLLQHRIPGLCWLGKHSLWVYLAHQPVAYGVLAALHMAGLV